MRSDEDRNVMVSVLAGIGIGVLVGAVAGLLLAPKSGEETRGDLGSAMNDLSGKVTELGKQVSSTVSGLVERGRAGLEHQMSEPTTEEQA